MIAVWSVSSFIGMWLLMLGLGVLIARAVGRLEKDDGDWRRGL